MIEMSDNLPLPSQQLARPDGEPGFVELLHILLRHKKAIIGMTLGAMLASIAVSLSLPNIYTATSKILPPQQSQSSAAAMLNQLGGAGLGGVVGGALGMKNPADIYIAMLSSRSLQRKIVTRLNLQAAYGVASDTAAINLLGGRTNISLSKNNVISVSVDDKDPVRAAAVANAYVDELNKFMLTFALTDASLRRQFLEGQMKALRDKLTDAEIRLDGTPRTSLQYLDAVRNLKYQESIFEVVSRQFEIAKMDEAKNLPLVQVLDAAEIPEYKSSPKRGLMVAMAAFSAFLLTVVVIIVRDAFVPRKKSTN